MEDIPCTTCKAMKPHYQCTDPDCPFLRSLGGRHFHCEECDNVYDGLQMTMVVTPAQGIPQSMASDL